MNSAIAVSAILFTAASLIAFSETHPQFAARTDYELCQEVREEVNLQVDVGLIPQEEADRIVRRCFTLFVK